MKTKQQIKRRKLTKMEDVSPSGNQQVFSQPRNMNYTQPLTESGGHPVLADDTTQRPRTLEWIPTEQAPLIFILKDILTELRLINAKLR